MRILLALSLLSLSAFGIETTHLVVGLSRTLQFNKDMGRIVLDQSRLLDYRPLKDGAKQRRLLLIPKNAGIAKLTINDKKDKPLAEYEIEIHREGDVGFIEAQFKAEETDGIPVKKLAIKVGKEVTEVMEKDIGAIHLTQPHIVDFLRIPRGDTMREIRIKAKSPGFTDLSLNNEHGRLQKKYYISVIP